MKGSKWRGLVKDTEEEGVAVGVAGGLAATRKTELLVKLAGGGE